MKTIQPIEIRIGDIQVYEVENIRNTLEIFQRFSGPFPIWFSFFIWFRTFPHLEIFSSCEFRFKI